MLDETLRIYKMLTGEIEPDPDVHLLRMYYAYHGLTDKYIASRRPNEDFMNDEVLCVIRGIYHSKEFAHWCKDNLFEKDVSIPRAISSRMIMDDDLSFIYKEIYCIWYPKLATEETYRRLYKIDRSFAYQIARACAVGNYIELLKELDIEPEMSVLVEADDCGNDDIVDYIHNKAMETGTISYYMQDEHSMICLTQKEEYSGVLERCCMTVPMMKNMYLPVSSCYDEDEEISFDVTDIESHFSDYDILGDSLLRDSKLQRKMNSIKKLL